MRAADMAISNPLLDDVTMKGAKGVLINITGGPDLMLFEVEQAANRLSARKSTPTPTSSSATPFWTIWKAASGSAWWRPASTPSSSRCRCRKRSARCTPISMSVSRCAHRNRMPVSGLRPIPQPDATGGGQPGACHQRMRWPTRSERKKSPAEDYILGGADAPELPAGAGADACQVCGHRSAPSAEPAAAGAISAACEEGGLEHFRPHEGRTGSARRA